MKNNDIFNDLDLFKEEREKKEEKYGYDRMNIDHYRREYFNKIEEKEFDKKYRYKEEEIDCLCGKHYDILIRYQNMRFESLHDIYVVPRKQMVEKLSTFYCWYCSRPFRVYGEIKKIEINNI